MLTSVVQLWSMDHHSILTVKLTIEDYKDYKHQIKVSKSIRHKSYCMNTDKQAPSILKRTIKPIECYNNRFQDAMLKITIATMSFF